MERAELLEWVDEVLAPNFEPKCMREAGEQFAEVIWQAAQHYAAAAEAKGAVRIAELERQLAEAKAAVPVGKQIGWYTMGTKDGKRNFEDPVLATNPFYISAHSEYEWLPVFAAPQVAEQTKQQEPK